MADVNTSTELAVKFSFCDVSDDIKPSLCASCLAWCRRSIIDQQILIIVTVSIALTCGDGAMRFDESCVTSNFRLDWIQIQIHPPFSLLLFAVVGVAVILVACCHLKNPLLRK
jgi:hypothetical protein